MKNIFCCVFLLLCSLVVLADSAYQDSIQVRQSDGTMLWTKVYGDEFYNWRSTTDGHIILRDEQKVYRYAMVKNDSLVPSNIMVHNIQNRDVNEVTFIRDNAAIVQKFLKAEQQVVLMQRKEELSAINEENSGIAPQTTALVMGKRKILTILMGFKDRPFTKTASDFDKLMNQKSGMVEVNHGSVWQFYNEDSYGSLDVSSVVVGPFVANFKSSYYKEGKDDGTQTSRELVREAIHRASESGVNFSELDGDGDGYVDCVQVIFAGHGMSSGAEDGLIWPHQAALVSAIIRDGKKAKKYIITPELGSDDKIAPIGTICHEFGHILGAPDFYDRIDQDRYNATGQYDLMCNGSWNYGGHRPAHHNAYTKCYLFGWAHAEVITNETKEYRISSSTLKPEFYRINTTNGAECFLVENRIRVNFDRYIPQEGLVIYHIHKDIVSTIEKDKFINSQHPLMCYIVNAYAKHNPTSDPNSYGFLDSQRTFGIGDRTYYGNSSIPTCATWNGYGIGINLCFIKQNSDKSISFTVNPQIEGPDHLCGKRTYSVTGVVPDKDTIVWSYSFSSAMTEVKIFPAIRFSNGNKGASVVVERGTQPVRLIDSIGTPLPDTPIKMSAETAMVAGQPVLMPYTGTVTLYATIHSGNGTYTMEKEIELPKNAKPEIDLPIGKKPLWFANQTRSFTETAVSTIEGAYIRWYVQYPKDTAWSEYTGRSVSLTPTKGGTLTMRVVNDCGCPTLNEATYTFDISEKIVQPPIIMKSYQNPVNTSSIAISVERNADAEIDVATFAVQEELPNYTIELWSELQGRVRTLTSNAEHVSLDVAWLPSGWYQLLLLQDGQLMDSGNVLIAH